MVGVCEKYILLAQEAFGLIIDFISSENMLRKHHSIPKPAFAPTLDFLIYTNEVFISFEEVLDELIFSFR